MFVLSLILQIGCLTAEITKTPGEFPDNPTDDYDGDGLTEQSGDCDDLNPEIQGPSTWYADADGDGFGDASQSVISCLSELLALDEATSYVANADDCDDSDSETYPGSSREGGELCVRDADGDGYGDSTAAAPYDAGTDCNDADASIFPNNARFEDDELCVVDADGDGYGDAIPSVAADPGSDCDDSNALIYPGYNNEAGTLCILDADGDGFGQANAPQPYDSGSDCDDTDAEIHPDMEESCDGVDNDCSGEVDDYQGNNAPRWYYDDDNDGFGNSSVSIYACNAPVGYVSDSTDCNDSNADAYPNAPEFCDGIDTNCNGIDDDNSAQDATLWYQDGDADGYGSGILQASCSQPSGFVADSGDCNDNNAAIFPGADEYCNSVDDNCDGQTDELGAVDATTFYADIDGDGFGNAVVTEQTCVASPGYVVANTDCDDGDSAVYPNADELCNNGKDDDCDGQQDESDAVDPLAWYADNDTDGYGDPLQIAYACLAPSGHVDNNDDCDDSDAAVSPDANEICDSLSPIDNDCDGLIDDFDLSLDPTTGIAFYADSDQDGFGNAFDEVFACSQPLGYVENNTDCDDGDPLQRPGGVEYCNSADDDCDGQVDEEDAVDRWEFFYDGDQDGHGIPDPSLMISSCPQPGGEYLAPTGYSLLDDDCNDAESGISPSADELCTDTIDEDCDGDTTFAAVDFQTWFGDIDSDGQGSPIYAIDSCTQPIGYVSNSDDCNDTDPNVLSGMPVEWEICNGKLDRCEDDVYGDARTPDNERDDDDDGFVECVLDVDPLLWEDPNATRPLGQMDGGDCEDDDANAYPGAPEICNGVVDSFSGDGSCNEALPVDEVDNDGDCFVECSGFDASTWEGGSNDCAYIDTTGQLIQETIVLGGYDCLDDGIDAVYAYPGAAYLDNPNACACDLDFDGYDDLCNFSGCSGDAEWTMEVVYGLWACVNDSNITTHSQNFDMCASNFTPVTYDLIQSLSLTYPTQQENDDFWSWYQSLPTSGDNNYIRTGQKRRGGCSLNGEDLYISKFHGLSIPGEGWYDLYFGGGSCSLPTSSANQVGGHSLAGVLCVNGNYVAPYP